MEMNLQEVTSSRSGERPVSGNVNAPSNEVHNLLEAMTNLIYLARVDSDQPHKVQNYLSFTDDCLKRLCEILLCSER